MMLLGLCSNYDIMMLSCLYYALIMRLRQLTCHVDALIMMYDDYHLYEIIVPM